ncbi:MAG: hypothetical protein KGQ52_08190 [Alphaproteobacteria bacterium]|nr:hypothetical protein [Alphaproteobacteria bacterium]
MRLRRDICLGSLAGLPRHSSGWRASLSAQLDLLKQHGYHGVVAWGEWDAIRAAGLLPCGMARVTRPAEALAVAQAHQDQGLDFTTLHAGTGLETDAEMDRLADAILAAASRTGHALHVETHRATMTQDIALTRALLARFPDLALTLDFSHWYSGHELTYGGEFAVRLAACASMFGQVRSLQLRFGSTGRIQAPFDAGAPWHADHVAALDACLAALAARDITLSCAPELLPACLPDGRSIAYADAVETSDRFADALALSGLAEARCAALPRLP